MIRSPYRQIMNMENPDIPEEGFGDYGLEIAPGVHIVFITNEYCVFVDGLKTFHEQTLDHLKKSLSLAARVYEEEQ